MKIFVLDIDGGWTEWHECSATCGGGTQERTCTNPPKSGNGADCEGESTMPCGEDDCPGTRFSYRTVYEQFY